MRVPKKYKPNAKALPILLDPELEAKRINSINKSKIKDVVENARQNRVKKEYQQMIKKGEQDANM